MSKQFYTGSYLTGGQGQGQGGQQQGQQPPRQFQSAQQRHQAQQAQQAQAAQSPIQNIRGIEYRPTSPWSENQVAYYPPNPEEPENVRYYPHRRVVPATQGPGHIPRERVADYVVLESGRQLPCERPGTAEEQYAELMAYKRHYIRNQMRPRVMLNRQQPVPRPPRLGNPLKANKAIFQQTNNVDDPNFQTAAFFGGPPQRHLGDDLITKQMVDQDRAGYSAYITDQKESPFPPYDIRARYENDDSRRAGGQTSSLNAAIKIDNWTDDATRYDRNPVPNAEMGRRRRHSQARFDPIPPNVQTQRRHSFGQDFANHRANPPSPLVVPTPRPQPDYSAPSLHGQFTFDLETRRALGYN